MGAKTIGSVDVMKLPSYSNYSTLKFYVKYFFMEIGVLADLLPQICVGLTPELSTEFALLKTTTLAIF